MTDCKVCKAECVRFNQQRVSNNVTIDKHSNLRGWAAAQPFKGSKTLVFICLIVLRASLTISGPAAAAAVKMPLDNQLEVGWRAAALKAAAVPALSSYRCDT